MVNLLAFSLQKRLISLNPPGQVPLRIWAKFLTLPKSGFLVRATFPGEIGKSFFLYKKNPILNFLVAPKCLKVMQKLSKKCPNMQKNAFLGIKGSIRFYANKTPFRP